jgi:serine/threonine protein kinase
MSVDPHAAKAIFMTALDKADPAERAAYLAAACGGDELLRQRVELLLKAHSDPGSFMPSPAVTIDAPVAESPGTVIGAYKLLEQIGEGGMGTVWMAQQAEPVRRLVALKLIKAGMDSNQVIARFEAERQVLAIMDHPSIAKVHDGGVTTSGRPYFVMELVKGIPITDFCDQSQFSVEERLGLLISVCQAVQHAHQKGVIHRDLKPANVVVTRQEGVPAVKVIDFGIAKAVGQQLTDKTLFTGFAQMIGTPLYMSPEQAAGGPDIDTRSDIYSLGVLMYELLTGTTPFDMERFKEAGYDEMRRIIREEEPPRPSVRISTLGQVATTVSTHRKSDPRRLSQLFRGELDWIVMKCLEKDRNRRYETSNGLALDLLRYLHDEAVQACPPSAWYRLHKFVKRHRAPVVGAALVLLALVVGVVGTTHGMVWAVRERDDKSKALIAETQARENETHAREMAMAALRSMTEEFVEKRLASGEYRLSDEDREFLRDILQKYQQFAALPGDDAEQRGIRAEGHLRAAILCKRLGEEEAAESSYRKALSLYEQLATDFPSRPELGHEFAMCHARLGNLFYGTGRLKDAELAFQVALAIQKRLVADFPSRPEFRQGLAVSLSSLGLSLRDTGRLTQAESAYVDAISNQRQLVADFPSRPEFRLELAETLNNLGILLELVGRLKDAETAHLDALAINKRLVVDFSARPRFRENLAMNQTNLGQLLRITGRQKEAETAFQEALALHTQLAADFPTRPVFRNSLAKNHLNLGNLLREMGRLQEAETAYRLALALEKQLAADFPTHPEFRQELAGSYTNLGNVLKDTDRLNEAVTAYQDAIATGKQLAADFPACPEYRHDLGVSHNNLGQLFRLISRPMEAETAYQEAIALQSPLAAEFPNRPEFRSALARCHSDLGVLYRATGRAKEAETGYQDALAIRRQLALDFPTRPELRRDLGQSHNNLGNLFRDTGRMREAEVAYQDALAIKRKLATDFPNQPDLRNEFAGTCGNLAALRLRQRDFQSAIALLEEAMPHHEAVLQGNPRNPTFQQFYRNNLAALVRTSAGLGDQAAAQQAAEKLRNVGGNPSGNAYIAACALALCIPIVEGDRQASQEARADQSRFYGDEAMKMLRDAVARGFKDAAQMKKDRNLDPLRERQDFRKLLGELETAKAAKPAP